MLKLLNYHVQVKPRFIGLAGLGAWMLLSGCQTIMSEQNKNQLAPVREQLEQAEAKFEMLDYSSEPLEQARESYNQAVNLARLWRPADQVRHYAELAEQYVLVAEEQVILNQLLQAYEMHQATVTLLSQLGAERIPRGMRVVIDDLGFRRGEVELAETSRMVLRDMALLLSRYPLRKVLIEGYTDDAGSQAVNQRFSEQRAEMVRSELTKLGVDSQRLRSIGYGEAFPLASNQNPVGREQNRRVELVIGTQDQGFPPLRTTQSQALEQPASDTDL